MSKNINPFSSISPFEDNVDESFNNKINKISFNDNEPVNSQNINISFKNLGSIKKNNNPYQNNKLSQMNNMNNMLIHYGNYHYPYNNPFNRFYCGKYI